MLEDFLALFAAPPQHLLEVAVAGRRLHRLQQLAAAVGSHCTQTTRWAWANFARKGDPSQPGLKWGPFRPASGRTMVFDNDCRMTDDPEGEVRKILLA